MVRPGVTHDQLKQHSIRVLTEGMIELGLLKGEPEELIKEKKHEQFYMHGLGHMLGIDVHDVGRYWYGQESRALEPGVVMTVEPACIFRLTRRIFRRATSASECELRMMCCARRMVRAC